MKTELAIPSYEITSRAQAVAVLRLLIDTIAAPGAVLLVASPEAPATAVVIHDRAGNPRNPIHIEDARRAIAMLEAAR